MAILFVLFAPSYAATTNEITENKQAITESLDPIVRKPATVTVLNRNIITFNTELLGMSAEGRARRAELIISEHLKQSSDDTVSTVDSSVGTIVKVGDETVFFISPLDMDAEQQLTLADVVKSSEANLQLALAESRQSQDVEFMIQALTKTAVAILLFVAFIWLIRRALKSYEGWLFRFAHSEKISLGGAESHIRPVIMRLGQYLALAFYWLLVLLITYECLSYVLEQFPHTRPWGEQLRNYLFGVATNIGKSTLHAIPDLFVALVIFMIARLIVKGMGKFFQSVSDGQTKVNWVAQDVALTTKRILVVIIWLFAFVMAYPYLPGSGTEAFKGISVLVGLLLSLGASSLVSQAGSGLILTYTRTFRVGDYVSIGENQGTVVDLGMFTTRIRDGMGVEFAFPNSYILSTVTKNYSRSDQASSFVMDASVTIGYDTPWRQVHALLQQAALKTPGILANPEPVVYQTELSDFYPKYKLVCHATPIEAPKRVALMSQLHANIQDLFNEYGVQIMSPHYIDDPKSPKIVPESEWVKAPAKPNKVK